MDITHLNADELKDQTRDYLRNLEGQLHAVRLDIAANLRNPGEALDALKVHAEAIEHALEDVLHEFGHLLD